MRKKMKQRLRQMFPLDPDGKTFIIEAWLDNYDDIFNEWDPAPFKRRDIDPDLVDFLEACGEDIPLKYPVSIRFMIKPQVRNKAQEASFVAGIHNYFRFSKQSVRKKLSETNRRILLYTLIAIAFLVIAIASNQVETENLLVKTAVEGLFIGGWVFLWNAIETVFFDARDIRFRYKFLERFHLADITFVDEPPGKK